MTTMKMHSSMTHRGLLPLLGLALALCTGGTSRAQEADAQGEYSMNASSTAAGGDDHGGQTPIESKLHSGLLLGGKVGGGLGKPWSDFGATPVFELELGYALPPLHRAIQLFFSGQYTQPGMSGTSGIKDQRLPGNGLVSYDVLQQELTLSFGGLYRFDVGSKQVMPYGGIGGRLYMLDTKVKGSVGSQAYGRNQETQTRVGLLLLGGAELYVGPGALLAELSFGWASVNSFVLRNTNLGALNLAVGYRLML
jgi:hypothetical protein